MNQSLLARLSPEDLDLYAHLPKRVKDEASDWFQMISDVGSAKNGARAAALRSHAVRLKKSVAQCARKYYEWSNGTELYPAGDWRILINRKKAGPAFWASEAGTHSKLPFLFLEHWRKLCGDNQRAKCEAAYRQLLYQYQRWLNGDPASAVPGYSTCPSPDAQNMGAGSACPRGWSYRNLMRHKPHPVEQTLSSIGTAAAIKLLPPVPGTRRGARFLEYVFFDDVWLDRKCIVPGYREPCRLLQLGCLDYATGVYLKFGQRPELPSGVPPSSGAAHMERLKESEMKLLVAMFLEDYGFPDQYDMHLIVERGTAVIRPPDAQALFDLSGGRIKVCYTSMEGGLVLVFAESSSGNSRGKAPLESWHNLFHNESAHLPGQVGKDREHSPAELLGRERAAVALNTAAAILPPAQRARLRLPFPSREQALWETHAVVDRINRRTDHDLEGFDDLILWRLKGTEMPWQPESALLSMQSTESTLSTLLEFTARKESPAERLTRLRAQSTFRKLPAGLIYERFYSDSHILKKFSEPTYIFEFQKDGRNYRYRADGVPPSSGAATSDHAFLPPGEYLAYYNPSDMSRIHLTSKGRFISTWNIEDRIARGDTAALAKEIARKQGLLNGHLAAVRRRHADVIQQREADLRANEALLQEAGLAPVSPIPPTDNGPLATDNSCATALQTAVAQHAASRARQSAPAPEPNIDPQLLAAALSRDDSDDL